MTETQLLFQMSLFSRKELFHYMALKNVKRPWRIWDTNFMIIKLAVSINMVKMERKSMLVRVTLVDLMFAQWIKILFIQLSKNLMMNFKRKIRTYKAKITKTKSEEWCNSESLVLDLNAEKRQV